MGVGEKAVQSEKDRQGCGGRAGGCNWLLTWGAVALSQVWAEEKHGLISPFERVSLTIALDETSERLSGAPPA